MFFDKRRFIDYWAAFSDDQLTLILGLVLLAVFGIVVSVIWKIRVRQYAIAEAIFSQGLEKVGFLSFSGPPTAGCKILSDSVHLQMAGLQVDDVVVALEGYRIENEIQYAYINGLSRGSHMRLIIWRVDRYLDIVAWVANRNLEVELKTHPST